MPHAAARHARHAAYARSTRPRCSSTSTPSSATSSAWRTRSTAAGVRAAPARQDAQVARSSRLKQMALGAVGMCCQKVSEAEAMVEGGVPRRARLQRGGRRAQARPAGGALPRAGARHRLRRRSRSAVDGAGARRPRATASRLDVLVEINVGASRCGVDPGEPAVALAQAHRAREAPPLRRPAGLPGPRPAHPHHRGAPRRDRRGDRAHARRPCER